MHRPLLLEMVEDIPVCGWYVLLLRVHHHREALRLPTEIDAGHGRGVTA